MAYSKKVVQRFEDVLNNPEKHAVGRFDPKDPNVATGLVGAPACGDVMKLDLKMNGDKIGMSNSKLMDVVLLSHHLPCLLKCSKVEQLNKQNKLKIKTLQKLLNCLQSNYTVQSLQRKESNEQ